MKNPSDYETLKNQIIALIDEWNPSGAALLEIAADVADLYPSLSPFSGLLSATHEQMVILEHREALLKKNGIPIV
ncbi:MAG: hypothetical protein AAGF93_01760 [Cyanobacteria bacterium P01_H01_bin.105]